MFDSEHIVFVDKPTNLSSHQVVKIFRQKTGEKRVGHAGTLDPLATGLLIILVGRNATRQQSLFLKLDKEYECTMQLGVETDTYDVKGRVVRVVPWSEVEHITRTDVEKILSQFRGRIQQTVPAFSAVKIHGKSLYKRALHGNLLPEDLPIKEIEIFELELTNFAKDEAVQKILVQLRVHCSSGTYIRSLVHDIGRELGVGAVVTQLRRTKIGEYSVENAQQI